MKKYLWIFGSILALVLIAYLYSSFFKPTYGGNNTIGLILLGLMLGAIISFLSFKLLEKRNAEKEPSAPVVVRESSHTVIESMKKVFKIVCAEGQFSEIYNYEQTRRLLAFIPSTKKALVIVQAKVLVGYDFEKAVWEADETTGKMKIVSFPQPEILSIDTDYKYYNLEENLFDLFSKADFERIQVNGKRQVEKAAMGSHLGKFAAEQMKTLLTQVAHNSNWELENSGKITNLLPEHIPGGEVNP